MVWSMSAALRTPCQLRNRVHPARRTANSLSVFSEPSVTRIILTSALPLRNGHLVGQGLRRGRGLEAARKIEPVKATPFNQRTIAEFQAKKGRGVGMFG